MAEFVVGEPDALGRPWRDAQGWPETVIPTDPRYRKRGRRIWRQVRRQLWVRRLKRRLRRAMRGPNIGHPLD